jgi:hypothetical protein
VPENEAQGPTELSFVTGKEINIPQACYVSSWILSNFSNHLQYQVIFNNLHMVIQLQFMSVFDMECLRTADWIETHSPENKQFCNCSF